MPSDRIFNTPFRILILTLLLLSIGVIMVYSASGRYSSDKRRRAILRHQGEETLAQDHEYHDARMLQKQIFFIAIGLVSMFAAYVTDYAKIKNFSLILLIASFGLLCLVFVPGIGISLNDHRRWLNLGISHFQPSELAKLALIIYMAHILTDHHKDVIDNFKKGVLPALIIMAIFDLIIIAEPDIGAAVVITAIVFTMWFIGGMRLRYLIGLVAATIPAFVYVVLRFPDKLARVIAFVNPTPDAMMGKRYQLTQSLTAVGSGGLTGVGLGNSMQKHYLTEQYSEFIFAIAAEELGLIGAGLIILLYFLLIWEGWRTAFRAPDFYSTVLASGITIMLAISIGLNMMVVLGLAPTKGLSLPLMSYGGSNMVVTLTSIGLLMNVGKYIEKDQALVRSPVRKKQPRKKARKKKKAYQSRFA
ncbi:MAG: FtsW/RodA/SpoVE family cell cycle protein [Candidatus Sumerlaeia bacterium]